MIYRLKSVDQLMRRNKPVLSFNLKNLIILVMVRSRPIGLTRRINWFSIFASEFYCRITRKGLLFSVDLDFVISYLHHFRMDIMIHAFVYGYFLTPSIIKRKNIGSSFLLFLSSEFWQDHVLYLTKGVLSIFTIRKNVGVFLRIYFCLW